MGTLAEPKNEPSGRDTSEEPLSGTVMAAALDDASILVLRGMRIVPASSGDGSVLPPDALPAATTDGRLARCRARRRSLAKSAALSYRSAGSFCSAMSTA